jgi:DNA primase
MRASDVQSLRELSIEGVACNLGMKVSRHKALCPFHGDRHPSLSFHVGRNVFRCFVCGAHGDTIALAMQVLGVGFKEACRWLAKECGGCGAASVESPAEESRSATPHSFEAARYAPYFERPYLNGAARDFLYGERRIDPRVVRWCRLTSWTDRRSTAWLQMPYYDVDGTLIGVQNRRLGKGEGPRFMFPRGSQCRIYNLPVLKRLQEGEELWITEGASDCWAMLSSGRKAIAIPSATVLVPKDLEVLGSRNVSLHMSPDNDAPGERLFSQLKTLFPRLECHPLPEGVKDFGELWKRS